MAAFCPLQQLNILYGTADGDTMSPLCLSCCSKTTLSKNLRTTFASLFQGGKWSSGGFADSMLGPGGLWCLMAGEAPQVKLWVSSGHLFPRCCPKADPGSVTDEFYGLLAYPGASWGSGPLYSTKQLSSVTQMIYDGAITTLSFLCMHTMHTLPGEKKTPLSILVFSVHHF